MLKNSQAYFKFLVAYFKYPSVLTTQDFPQYVWPFVRVMNGKFILIKK